MPRSSVQPLTKQTEDSSLRLRRRNVLLRALIIVAFACAVGGAGAASHATAGSRAARTPAANNSPTMPKRLTVANATATSLTIAWTRSNGGVAGYEIYLAGWPAMTTSDTSYTISGLACGTTYTVGVAAYDLAGGRSRTAWTSASTAACAPPPPPPATVCSAGQYQATYFNNASLLAPAALTGCEAGPLNHDWGGGAPTGVVPDYFSARFTGAFDFQASAYTFTYEHDDGIRVYVDGSLVLEKWARLPSCPCPNAGNFSLPMTAGSHTISVEYQEIVGAADIALSWAPTAAPPPPPSTDGEPGPIAGQGYRKVFGDEFVSLDGAVWTRNVWWSPPVASDELYAQNGILHLVSRRSRGYPDIATTTYEPAPGAPQKRTFRLGYYEARVKIPHGNGSWPAFWLSSKAQADGLMTSAILNSEIDIFDLGEGTSVYFGGAHKNTNACCGVPDVVSPPVAWRDMGYDMSADWHTFSALWTPTEVVFYVDGREAIRGPVWATTNQEHVMIIDEWSPGWGSRIDASTPDVLDLQVDWVRVWQK